MDRFVVHQNNDFGMEAQRVPGDGVVTGSGRVHGRPVFAFAQGGSGGGRVVQGNSVAVIDPHSNQVIDGIAVGARPDGIAFGSGALWVANLG